LQLKEIRKTIHPSGGSITTIHEDGKKTKEPYGEIIETEYECPCGKGKIFSTLEDIPGYLDRYARIACPDCEKIYTLSFAGVNMGQAPEISKK